MSDIQPLLKRNESFAKSYTNNLNIIPRFSTLILTCADARVDPAQFLALEAGDALVMRNTGGRVTPSVELELGMLYTMVKTMQGENFKGFKLAIIHHTDCGMQKIANPQMITGISQRLGVTPEEIEALAINDHKQSLKDDIERLRQSTLVPKDIKVTAYLMDLETGLVKEEISEVSLA